jgi:hypothetical protein
MNRDAEPDIELLLRLLLQRGWMLLCCGSRTQPDSLAAVHRTQVWADVVILRGHDRAAAYRTLAQPPADPLQATRVTWHYLGDAERTLHAVLTIPPETATCKPYPTPQECHLPEAQHLPLTIRLGHQTHS